MYNEADNPRGWGLLLAGVFLLAMLPNLWLPELDGREAANALMAREILAPGGDFLLPRLAGEPVLRPPLAPWLLAGLGLALPLNELTVRLLGLLPLGLLAALCGWLARQRVSAAAAAATALTVAFSLVAVQKGASGAGDMWFCLLINCAWLSWYRASREGQSWLYAWAVGHAFMLLAILAGGPKAIFYFYFPLFWLRRPLRVWRRLGQLDHWLSLGLAAALLLLVILATPNVGAALLELIRDWAPERGVLNYLERLTLFPLRALLGFLPFVFLVWPAFCAAYRPLEPDRVFGNFLRRIVVVLFFFFWLMPDGRPSALLPLIGPLSLLVGLNYDLLVRRNGRHLQALARGLCWLAVVLGAAALAAGLFLSRREALAELSVATLAGSGLLLIAAVLVAAWTLRAGARQPVWASLLLALTALYWVHAGGLRTWQAAYRDDHRAAAERLTAELPPGVTIHTLLPGDGCSSLCYYLDRPVRKIQRVRELPFDRQVVYVLSTNEVPVLRLAPRPDDRHKAEIRLRVREWSAVSDPCELNHQQLRLWRGDRRHR